jgi:hypothetical protein
VSPRATRVGASCLLLAYYSWTVRHSLSGYFTGDDVMNLYGYWDISGADWLASAPKLFLDRYRPAGALFYLPIYRAFGLDPFPFHLAHSLLQALNVLLVFGLAIRWVGPATAILAAGVFAHHGGMGELRHNTGTIYDTLATLFALSGASLFLNGRGRASWIAFGVATWAGVLSKEHFAAFPAILAAVLMMEQRLPTRPQAIALGFATLAVLGAGAFRYWNDDEMLRLQLYRPSLDPSLIVGNIRSYWLWIQMASSGLGRAMAVATVVSLSWCWANRRWGMAGAVLWTVTSVAPLLVIAPRSGYVLYLAWPALALWLSLGVEWLRSRPRAATLAVTILLWRWHAVSTTREPYFLEGCARGAAINRSFAAAVPSLPRHSPDRPLLLVTNCWAADQWEPWFIARLAAASRDIHMDRARSAQSAPRPLEDYSATLVFQCRDPG